MCGIRVYYCLGDGKFRVEMRKLKVALSLLFASILALQGAVAMSTCVQFESSRAVVQTTGTNANDHCVHGSRASHPHACGAHCCGALVASTQALWAAPRSAAADIPVAVIWPSPTVALDRLDRPPRSL
jgi:hypothetical protein